MSNRISQLGSIADIIELNGRRKGLLEALEIVRARQMVLESRFRGATAEEKTRITQCLNELSIMTITIKGAIKNN